MRSVPATLAVTLLAMLTACGGGGDGGSDATSSKRAIQAEAQQRAESMLLQLSDFPDGWRASASDPTSKKDQRRFRECLGVNYSGSTITGEADSRDFGEGESTSASSSSAVYQSAAQAQQATDEYSRGLSGPAAEDCLRKLLGKNFDTNEVELDEIDVGELNVKNAPDVEETHAWEIVFTFNIKSGDAKGFSPSAYLDIINMRQGDGEVSLQTYDVLSPFESGLRDDLLAKLAGRMTAQPAPSE